MLPISHDPTSTCNLDYQWSPANQRAFLEQLAVTGIVNKAADLVSMSKNSAYRLRNRRDGLAFRIGWEAAISVARGRLIDDLMERALEGYEETATRSEDGREITQFKYDTRLAMAMVHRFDKRLDGPCEALPASELAFARIVAQDFEAFLDLIERDGGAAQLSLFLAARSDLVSVLSGSHLPQISDDCDDNDDDAQSEDQPTKVEPTPQEEAERMSVWHCADASEWRTDFPPPDEFDGEETGRFGDNDYERSLTDEEERVQAIVQHAALRPLRDAAQEAHERWFGGEAGAAVRAELAEEEAVREEARARRQAERERAAEIKAAEVGDAPAEPLALELAPVDTPAPEYDFAAAYQPDDPTNRVIQCKPRTNWALHGVMPPGVAAQLGIQLPHDDPRRKEPW